jgi:RNAse (barnase) inhibitor barstar
VDLREWLPGLRGQRFHVVPSADEPLLRRALGAAGFDVLTLAGSVVRNEPTLFAEVARALGLGPDFGTNWDALTDALGVLEEWPASRVAFVWVDADQSVAADLQMFMGAVLALDRVASDLGDVDAPGGRPRQIEIFLLGSGAGFPSVP